MGYQEDPESKAVEAPNVSDTSPGVLIDHNTVDREYGRTVRGLSPRHVQLMAIGGSIGTGLFVGIGGVLSKAGPLSVVLGYLIWGVFFVWPCNLCVAEMCSYLPIRGSIFELAARFVDPALAWVAMAMVICVLLNVVAVKYYGEAEFIMASLKVILLFGLLFITLITMCGGNPKGDAYGFRYWKGGKAMRPYHAEGDLGRFCGWWKVILYAGFTIAGPDMISLSSGEIANPRRTIPRVAKLIFYRLVGFYVLGVLAVGVICSSDDKRLLGAIEDSAAGAASSPWVIGIENLGIHGLPDLINFLILTSGLSCGNAYLYSSSRTLYGLARDGQAPAFLMKCNKAGVPMYCVLVVSLLSCITFLVAGESSVTVFFWFVDLTTTGLIATYTMMIVVFVGWYRARKAQGLDNSALHYVAPFNPYAAYIGLFLGTIALIFIGFDKFDPWSTQGFVTSYFCHGYAVILFVVWKVLKKTKFVNPKSADLVSGKKEVDEECKHWEEGGIEENYKRELAAMSFWKRNWERIW
ncbi:hypothetical protein ACHAQC_007700 [Fusarium culmorum]